MNDFNKFGLSEGVIELLAHQEEMQNQRRMLICHLMCILQELDPDRCQLVFADHGGSPVPQHPIDEVLDQVGLVPFDALQIIYFDGHQTEFVRHGQSFTRLIHLNDEQLLSLVAMVQSFYV